MLQEVVEINARFRIMANTMVIVVGRIEGRFDASAGFLDSFSRVIRGCDFGSVGITAQPLVE